MITTRSRFFSNRRGRAVIPSISGMSTSRMTTSGLARSTCSMASRPLRSDATTCIPASASIHLTNRPRTTTASSTIITRIASRPGTKLDCRLVSAILITNATLGLTPEHDPPDRTRIKLRQFGSSHFQTSCRIPPARASTARSDQADLLELCFHDVLVERLHDVFVGARVQRPRDMSDVVLGGAEHHLGPIAVRQPAQVAQELVDVHL